MIRDDIYVENAIEELKNNGYNSWAEVFQQLLDEHNRLVNLFQNLDKIYKPHSAENPMGLLDSPYSIVQNTRGIIDSALEGVDI